MPTTEPPEHRICRQKTDAEKKWFDQRELDERFQNQPQTYAAAIEELADMLPEAQSTI